MLNKTSVLVLVAVISLIAITACSAINKKLGLKDDNVAEEVSEAILKAETNGLVDVDFTPDSPEK